MSSQYKDGISFFPVIIFVIYVNNKVPELMRMLQTSSFEKLYAVSKCIGHHFQNNLMWQNQDPVAFHMARNTDDMLTDVTMLIKRGPENPVEHSESLFRSEVTIETQTDNSSCLAMAVYNLAFPRWIKVDCKKKEITAVVCMREQNIGNQSAAVHLLQKVFDKCCVIFDMSCYLFYWYPKQNNLLLKALRPIAIQSLEVLFRAVNTIFPPISLPSKKKIVSYEKYGNKFYYKEEQVNTQTEFYVITKEKTYQFNAGGNLFKCSNNVYISIYFICDQHVDCKEDKPADELDCECNLTKIYSQKCKYNNNNNVKEYCSFFYSKMGNFTCQMYTHLKDINKISSKREEVNDKHISCGGNNEIHFTVSDICTYKINESSILIPCINGQHLEICEAFECNMMFKCPKYYCIPWNYVCDGKWDCPEGYDEIINSR